jgi:hypothetical protein
LAKIHFACRCGLSFFRYCEPFKINQFIAKSGPKIPVVEFVMVLDLTARIEYLR